MIRKITMTIGLIIPLMFFGTANVCFGKEIKAGSFPIPMLVIDKDKGAFIELYNKITERIKELDFGITIYSPKKAKEMFYKGELDIIFPIVMPDKKYPKSEPIYEKKCFIFSLIKTKPALSEMSHLAGKSVALVIGFKYSEEISNDKDVGRYLFVADDISGMKMLSSGKVDAFVAEEKSGIDAIKQVGLENIRYNPVKPVTDDNVFIIFQSNPEGEKLSKRFTKILRKLKQEGVYGRIFSKVKEAGR